MTVGDYVGKRVGVCVGAHTALMCVLFEHYLCVWLECDDVCVYV